MVQQPSIGQTLRILEDNLKNVNEHKNDEFYWASASSETFPLYANISGSVPSLVEYSEEYNRRMGFWTQLLN